MKLFSVTKHSLSAVLSGLLIVLFVTVSIAEIQSLDTDQKLSPFYTWTQALPERPGQFLKSEALPEALMIDGAASAFRMLYSSIDGMDNARMTIASGVVYIPKGVKPEQGWPVMAWCHGTVGVTDKSAPSWSPRAEVRQTYLTKWLKRGFAVVAADYQGLGTPGVHPYLLFRAEGNSTLDGLRAALAKWTELRNDIVIVGQSQGGGAALGAAWLAPYYAEELNIVGTVALGAVADFKDRAGAVELPIPKEEGEYPIVAAYEALFLLGTMKAINPSLVIDDYVTEQGRELLQVAAAERWPEVKAKAKAMKITLSKMYKRPIDDLNKAYNEAFKIPHAHISHPVFTGTGLKDYAVEPAKQFNNVAAMCASGTEVEARFYPEQTHGSTVHHSFDDAIEFAERMLAGGSSKCNCDSLAAFARKIKGE